MPVTMKCPRGIRAAFRLGNPFYIESPELFPHLEVGSGRIFFFAKPTAPAGSGPA